MSSLPSALTLFLLPHGGGSASAFRGWAKRLLPEVACVALDYPGHGSRFSAPFLDSIEAVAEDALLAMQPRLDRPFAFFGHSMGAVVAFEVTHRLLERKLPLPSAVFVSGREAPHLPSREPTTSKLDDAQFLKMLQEMGGITEEVLQEPKLVELVLPILRQDFALLEKFPLRPARPLAVPVIAFGGTDDPYVVENDLGAWAEHTTRFLGTHMFPGSHFYLQEREDEVVKRVWEILRRVHGWSPLGGP